MNIPPRTEIQKKRAAWWAEHFKPGMTRENVFQLIEELAKIHPETDEERDAELKGWEGVPEFVL